MGVDTQADPPETPVSETGAVSYRVAPGPDRTDWWPKARAAILLEDFPDIPNAAKVMESLIIRKRPVQATFEIATAIQSWAAKLPGWPAEGHKPLKFERMSSDSGTLRGRWSVALWASRDERQIVERGARLKGQSTAGYILDAAVSLAKSEEEHKQSLRDQGIRRVKRLPGPGDLQRDAAKEAKVPAK